MKVETLAQSSMERMKWFKETHLANNRKYKILDVGSYDVNGSYKELFSNEQFAYSGLGMERDKCDKLPKHAYIWMKSMKTPTTL